MWQGWSMSALPVAWSADVTRELFQCTRSAARLRQANV